MSDSNQTNKTQSVDEIARLVLEQINKGEISSVVSQPPAPPVHNSQSGPEVLQGPASKLNNNYRPRTAATAQAARCLYDNLDEATHAAKMAQRKFLDCSMEVRKAIIANIRRKALEQAERIGQMAVDETGLGKMPDKMHKIILVANKTPGPEDLQPTAYSGDHGLTLTENAPWGVVGVITPSTNPPSTVLNNSISILSAGNSLVINPHPGAKAVSGEMAQLVHDAVIEAGGPANLVTCISNPTIESAQALMHHENIDLILVTGGGAVVKEAMASGKRAICAGPGNPPVLVDETAIIAQAGRDIVRGASFDNGVLCTDEKEIFVVDKVAHQLKHAMTANGAFEITGHLIDKLTNLLVDRDPKGSGYRHVAINRRFIGKSPAEILKQIDIKPPPGTKLVFFEANWDHPLVMAEQLMPVIPMVRVKTVEEGMEKAVLVEHQFKHTFVMHSTSIVNLSTMAQLCRGNIFVKNGFNMAGLGFEGEGYCSVSIAGTTGEGLTKASTFTRPRRCTLVDYFRII